MTFSLEKDWAYSYSHGATWQQWEQLFIVVITKLRHSISYRWLIMITMLQNQANY